MNKKFGEQLNLIITSLMMLLLGTVLMISCKKQNESPGMTSIPAGPDSGYAYVSYNFAVSASDPEGENIAYQFYWDDGDTSNWSDFVPSESVMTIAKVWSSTGNYLIRARAKDDKGAISFWSHAHLISISPNKPPAIPLAINGPSSGYEGRVYKFSTSTNDMDGDSISYQFDWGDGDTSNWSRFKPGDTLLTMAKSWSTQGTYLIRARAKDKKNAQSEWCPAHIINIGYNSPPDTPSTPFGPSIGYIGFFYDFKTSTHDPNGDSVSYQFDWGDGNTSNWSDFKPSGSDITLSHTWVSPNTYYIKVRAKDIIGAQAEWSDAHSIQIDSIDFPNRIITKIPVGMYPFDLVILPNGDYVYVTDLAKGNVWVIQTSNNTVVDTITVGDGPRGIIALPNNDYVYVAIGGGDSIIKIRTSDNTIVGSIHVGGMPDNLTALPDGSYIYVTKGGSNNVSVIRTVDDKLVATIPVGDYPSGITTLPNGEYVYVTNFSSNDVSVIRTSDDTVITTIPVGEGPNSAIATPDGEYVYVTNEYNANVSVIRTLDNSVVATIPVKSGVNDLAILPNGNYIYVSGIDVSIIRALNYDLVGTIPTGGTEGIATSPDGNYVYVANNPGNYITVIGW
jgi:YVTN family beta-propeller protein